MKYLYLLLLLLPSTFFAQTTVDINSGNPAFPFPQFLAYEYDGGHSLGNLGTQNPDGLVHAEMEKRISEAWLIMANRFIYDGDSHNGVQYIKSNEGCPYDCSEGAGYAMIAAAYMGDKTSFDGIWFREHDLRMVKQPRYIDGVTPRPDYKYGEFALAEPGGDSAADGDVDIALGLLMAWRQWGDDSGYLGDNGNTISYKQDALNVIRGLVERQNQGFGDCRSVSGIIGFDGYIKGGNTWNELTNWSNQSNLYEDMCPEFSGPTAQHIDYVAPAYFKDFAKFLEAEGEGEQEDIDWHIPQLERAEASSDWFMGELYDQGTNTVPVAGWVSLDESNNASFTNFQDGEDFRYAWRTILNHTWHGNPDVNWNPNTHQIESGSNSFNLDMGVRFSEFMKDPGAAGNGCKTPGTGMSFNGPSQLVQFYDPNTGLEGSTFPLNWLVGTGTPSSVSAQDYDLMGKLYRQCAIEWDQQSGQNLDSVPKYFHGFFRLLGMLITTGNFQSPMSIEPEANLKVYSSVDKTFSFTNDIVTYTLSYRNYGSIDAENVVLTDEIPEGLEFVSATEGGTLSGTSVVWNINNVPGFKTDLGVENTTGEVSVTFKVKEAFSGRVCNPVVITTSTGKGWTSNDFPNIDSEVMTRNCIDIVEKALEIEKTVDYEEVNPGDVVTYTVDVTNSSQGGYINGGRSGVNFSYARGNQDALGDTQGLKIRLFHGADEPYINYENYRVSLFLNDNVYKCIDGTDGCDTGWALRSNIYEGGDSTGVIVSQEDIVPGSNDDGKWNQRIIVQFAEQLSGPTPHLLRYAGLARNHEGGDFPLRGVWQLYTTNNGNSDWSDDWSWDPEASDSDGGFYYPVTNDWTDPDNPDQIVNIYHNEACDLPTKTVDNVLIEEWDGYTWRRIYGSGPVPGRDVENVVFKDVLPEGFTFVEFVGDAPLGIDPVVSEEDGRTVISWETDILQIGQDVQIAYKAIANFSGGKTCDTTEENQTNVASVSANNEAPIEASVDVLLTCNPVILPPAESSMVKEVSPISAEVGEEVVYTLSYKNEDGSPIEVSLNDASNWTAQTGSLMTINSSSITNITNSTQITTYDYSHGTNGILEASIDFAENAQFGFALRHTGGDIGNGLYLVFKPGPTAIEINLFDGLTLLDSAQLGTPGSNTEIKVLLNEGDLNVWLGDITSPSPSWVASDLPVRTGNFGFINGTPSGQDTWGSHTVTRFYSAMDSAFNLQIIDPVPGELTFVSSDEGELIDGVVTFPLQQGPVLAGEEFSYTWTAEVISCPSDLDSKIENLAYTNVLGIEENSIAAQAILDCSGEDLCGETPDAPTLVDDQDSISFCLGETAPNIETLIIVADDHELVWFDGPSKFDDKIDTPTIDTSEESEVTYYVGQQIDDICGEGDRVSITITISESAEGEEDTITIASGDAVDYDLITEMGYVTGNVMWIATDNINIEGESITNVTEDSITDILTNDSGVDQEVIYSIQEVTSGDCGKGISTLTVIITSGSCATEAPEVINADYCLEQLVTETLDFYIEAEGTITWYANDVLTSPAITIPTVDTSVSGDNTYYVTQTIDGCESERVEFLVSVQEIKPSLSDEIVIESGTSLDYDLLALGLTEDALSWSATENANITGETVALSNDNIISDTLVNITDEDQTIVYTIVESSTDGCDRENSIITVTVRSLLCPTLPPEIVDADICIDEIITTTLADYVTAEGTIVWYADNELTSVAITMPIIDTSVAGETVYYVSQIVDDCESVRSPIIITINGSETIQHTEIVFSGDSLEFDIVDETRLSVDGFMWSGEDNLLVDGETTSINSDAIIIDTLSNETDVDQEVTYTIIPFDCNEPTHVLTVIVTSVPSVEISAQSVVEGEDVLIELEFSKPTVSETEVTVTFTPTADGVSEDDMSLANEVIIIPAGTADFSFIRPTIDDDISELTESFIISIASADPENFIFAEQMETVSIFDNNDIPSILLDDIEINEGETKAVDIRLSNPSSTDITIEVLLSFVDDTTNGGDYQLLANGDTLSITFLAGDTRPSSVVSITAIDDSIPEGDQVLLVFVDAIESGMITDSSDMAEITIIDDDLEPSVVLDVTDVIEGDIAIIPIYLSSPALDRIEIEIAFNEIDTDNDFDTTAQTVVFEKGALTPTLPLEVATIQDIEIENDETFQVFIASINEGSVNVSPFLGLDTSIVIIQDDDEIPKINITSNSAEEGESLEIPISLSSPALNTLEILVEFSNTGSTSNDDYDSTSQTIIFNQGETTPTSPLVIPLFADEEVEGLEEFLIKVSVVTGDADTSNTSTIGGIIDVYVETLPECAQITFPINNDVDVAIRSVITWENIFNADGYYLNVGTTPNGTDVLDNFDVGDAVRYILPFNLESETLYYASITPYNSLGAPSETCNEISFTTRLVIVDKSYGISPNGDGINDFWEIEDIEDYPENQVLVYNRWGDLVFRINNYDNTFNVFNGEANQKTNIGAGELASGTYFYEIKIDEDSNDFGETKGFLVLKR